MKAQAVRVVMLANADLAEVHALIERLRNGEELTALETGVAIEEPIGDLVVAAPWQLWFDGIRWNAFLQVTG